MPAATPAAELAAVDALIRRLERTRDCDNAVRYSRLLGRLYRRRAVMGIRRDEAQEEANVPTDTDTRDALTVRQQATALLTWPDRRAALIRALDLASEFLTDLSLGDLSYNQDTCDTMREIGYVLSLIREEAENAR
jgi:hypothetical protein